MIIKCNNFFSLRYHQFETLERPDSQFFFSFLFSSIQFYIKSDLSTYNMIYSNPWPPFSLLVYHSLHYQSPHPLLPFFLPKFLHTIPSVFSLTVWIRIMMTSYDHQMNQWLHLTPLLSFQSHSVQSSPFCSSQPSQPSLNLSIFLSIFLHFRKFPTLFSYLL